MAAIHPTAIIDPAAEIGAEVDIGPYCVVGPHVQLGDRCRLRSHVALDGHTTIGEGCDFFPFCSIGSQTQDLKYRGGITRVRIGDHTTIREYVTVNSATSDGDCTVVGSRCHIMAYAHVAHDCQVGDEVIIANCGTLAGHVIVEDQVILGGLSAVHQFVRLGRLCITGGCSKVIQDIPPFMMADGNPLAVRATNVVGMERKGIAKDVQRTVKQAYRILYRQELATRQAVDKIRAELPDEPEIRQLIDFVANSERGITK